MMYPDDRVLIAYVPSPADWQLVVEDRWYRIPYKHAPDSFQSEYYAFYFGSKFGSLKYGIHYFAPMMGHELVRRRDLLPQEEDHPRADDWYYKIQLGEIRELPRPIRSKRWRRLTFAQTNWELFCTAREVSHLFDSPPRQGSSNPGQLRESWRWPIIPDAGKRLKESWQRLLHGR